jgi:flavin reductase (DIM6/NTAB) family NADH-FMN oxidoreductase RutF
MQTSNGFTDVTGKIDPREFRDALGQFATGVCIVTARDDEDNFVGMTVNSFNSVSLDPPLVLFSLARSSLGLESWLTAPHFAVNVLQSDQHGLADRFARASGDKWDDIEVEFGHTGLPLIPGALARFECATEHQYDGGDHVILVGRVIAFDRPARAAQPLTYFRGRYCRLTADSPSSLTMDDLWPHER